MCASTYSSLYACKGLFVKMQNTLFSYTTSNPWTAFISDEMQQIAEMQCLDCNLNTKLIQDILHE